MWAVLFLAIMLVAMVLWFRSTPAKHAQKVHPKYESTATPEKLPTPLPPRETNPPALSCSFFGVNDNVRDALATLDIKKVERGKGGRSVAFKITLADGSKGYFKPEQTFSGTHYYSEIAAYHVDRVMCLGRVAPVIGRRFRWADLSPVMAGEAKIKEVMVGEDGFVRGSFAHWVDAHLTPLDLGSGFERFFRFDGEFGVTPFQRSSDITLAHAKKRGERMNEVTEAEGYKRLEAMDTETRAKELSDMIVFDHLIFNIDRWGGQFTNVRTVEPKGPLMFLDNAAGFIPHAVSSPLMDSRLRGLQRFSRSMIEKVRTFSREAFEASLSKDPLAPVLTETQVDDMFKRRDQILVHVEAMRQKFGDAVFTWP